MKVRIQVKTGGSAARHILELPDDEGGGDGALLYAAIIEKTSLDPGSFAVLSGYPPRPIDLLSATPLKDLGITNNASIIVDVSHAHKPKQQATATSSFARKPNPTSTNTSANANADADVPSVSVGTRGTVTLRVMEDDNSCLFRAIGFVCVGGGVDTGGALRDVCCDAIERDPETWNDGVLGMRRSTYVAKLQRPDTWGGEIEMQLLATHFGVTLAAVDVRSQHIYRYNPDAASRKTVYVLYSGIHYDAIAMSTHPGAYTDLTQFDTGDIAVENAVIELARKLGQKGYYTDTATFTLKCNDCGTKLQGEKAAQAHAAATGHYNFGEHK
ncbi:ubiquitin-specific protease otu1 [Savitreella phatthalungensis]